MGNHVQPNVHCLVATLPQNSFIFNSLLHRKARLTRIILFLEGQIQLFRTKKSLKLNAQSASKCPECGYQNDSAVPAVGGDIALRQQIVTIRNGLPPP